MRLIKDSLRIELGETQKSTCHCCGKDSVTVHGFIYRNEKPHAVYYGGWAIAHPKRYISMAVAVGRWDEGSGVKDRTSFGLNVFPTDSEIQFSFIGPNDSPWGETDLLGKMFDRNQALQSPLSKDILALGEYIIEKDQRIGNYLRI
jgi:hypothetical protein